jgi:hypothetical protein
MNYASYAYNEASIHLNKDKKVDMNSVDKMIKFHNKILENDLKNKMKKVASFAKKGIPVILEMPFIEGNAEDQEKSEMVIKEIEEICKHGLPGVEHPVTLTKETKKHHIRLLVDPGKVQQSTSGKQTLAEALAEQEQDQGDLAIQNLNINEERLQQQFMDNETMFSDEEEFTLTCAHGQQEHFKEEQQEIKKREKLRPSHKLKSEVDEEAEEIRAMEEKLKDMLGHRTARMLIKNKFK